ERVERGQHDDRCGPSGAERRRLGRALERGCRQEEPHQEADGDRDQGLAGRLGTSAPAAPTAPQPRRGTLRRGTVPVAIGRSRSPARALRGHFTWPEGSLHQNRKYMKGATPWGPSVLITNRPAPIATPCIHAGSLENVDWTRKPTSSGRYCTPMP